MSRHDISYLQKQRQAELAKFNQTIEKLRSEETPVKPIEQKFASTSDGFEDLLKEQTIGLSSLAEYSLKREQVQEALDGNTNIVFKSKKRKMAEPTADDDANKGEETRKKPKIEISKLSFVGDEEETEDPPLVLKKTSLKNPHVDTSFLPDKERDEALQREKLLQKQLWLDRQERIKNEVLKVDFNFFDGTTHPGSYSLKKGQAVREVLEYARRTFQELRKLSVDNLILVKDNYIVPAYLTFYELIETYGGEEKTTTLAHWDQESAAKHHFHVARIMERKLYEKNKHIYPYTLWEEFDEFKQQDFAEQLKQRNKEKELQREREFLANLNK